MAIPNIKQLDTLINCHIGESKIIIDKKITRLTAPGDNYGSEMLKVDLVVKSNETGATEELNVVAKLIPSTEFFQEVFNIQVTFKCEKAFYDTIVPTLHDFQKKQGVDDIIDFYPAFFGSRNNLKYDDGQVDGDAVLLLENLKVKGYINVDRRTGFDIPTTKLILKCLAQFHAVPIALKEKDRKTFETKIKPFMACFLPCPPKPKMDPVTEKIISTLEESEKISHLIPKLRLSFNKMDDIGDTFNEPFSTLVHRDLWVNNIMLKFNKGAPINCKFVDFQLYTYDSPAIDLIFFLFSSVEIEALQNNLDDFLTFYLEQFNSTLKNLKSDLSLSYDGLINEICNSTESQLGGVVFMTLVVIISQIGGPPPPTDAGPPDMSKVVFDERAVAKILWVIEEWDKRGWMKF